MYSTSLTFLVFFFFNDTPTNETYTLSLHDALPISVRFQPGALRDDVVSPLYALLREGGGAREEDRKSTRLNSSHVKISYAVFCLKKKNRIYHYKRLLLTRYSSLTTNAKRA